MNWKALAFATVQRSPGVLTMGIERNSLRDAHRLFFGETLGRIDFQENTQLMARMVKCVKLGRELPGLDEAPFDTPLGQRIYENVSAEAWRMWSEHSKMLLNEYRLQPWKPEAQQFLVEQMEAYFFGPGSSLPKEYVPPPKS